MYEGLYKIIYEGVPETMSARINAMIPRGFEPRTHQVEVRSIYLISVEFKVDR